MLRSNFGDNLTLLQIVRSQLPVAVFVFLSACHTAEPTEDRNGNEGLHIAIAIQFCGCPERHRTTWAMADTDGVDLSKHIFSQRAQDAEACHITRDLRERFSLQ
ncbi:hypothetical protein EDB83DRAFT_2375105 [Lactarius deliciosus]|nr:hypothetical protein EDB83DRAFT_2375105 [Lactarius deliciosus]